MAKLWGISRLRAMACRSSRCSVFSISGDSGRAMRSIRSDKKMILSDIFQGVGTSGIRHRGGVTFVQALVRNLGICILMLREPFKRRPRENQSTNAKYRGGVMRSSVEGTVMVLERRHDLIRFAEGDNCATG